MTISCVIFSKKCQPNVSSNIGSERLNSKVKQTYINKNQIVDCKTILK